MRKLICLFICLFVCSCAFNAFDPTSFAPSTHYAEWIPLKKNKLISSKYCTTILPPSYENEELSLAELIDIALQNNPDTKTTWYEAKAQAAKYGQTLSEYFPAFSFTNSFTRQRGVTQGFSGVSEDAITSPLSIDLGLAAFYLTTVTPELFVSYTLLDFGQRRATTANAREALQYANYNHNQQIQTTLRKVMDKYYDYVYQKELLVSLNENLQTTETTLDAAKEKFKSGVVALGDVAQSKSSFLQAKIDSIMQKEKLNTSFAELLDSIGLPSTLKCKVKELPECIELEPILETIDELVEKAKKQRPEFLAAQAKVKSEMENYYLAKADSRPVVDTTFEIGKNYWNQGLSEKYHFTWQVNLSMPLFKGFFYRNGVKKAEANWKKSSSEMMNVELAVIKDVTIAYGAIESANESYAYAEEFLSSALLQYDIALKNYKAGTNTILDVLNAQNSLADARTKFVLAKKDWYVSLAQLAHATGSLCSYSDAKEKP